MFWICNDVALPELQSARLMAARSDGAWLRCLGRDDIAYCWDEHGRRRAAGPAAFEEEVLHTFSVGEAGLDQLSKAQLECQFEFELVRGLVVASTQLLRDLPLRQLPESSLAPLPAGTSTVDVAAKLRRGYDGHDTLYVADAAGAGHGLFATRSLPPGTCLGEYAGLLREDSDHTAPHDEATAAGAAGDASPSAGRDRYMMRYPAAGLHVSARELGGLLRFANHALVGAGANIDIVPCMVDGAWHLVGLTTCAVAAAEQLRFDYGGYAAEQAGWSGVAC